ncbi:MAG: hypothetical protein IKZ09_01460 [Clostridia bacterium]|nr:hypothetical protein [Clostridia bacterium]
MNSIRRILPLMLAAVMLLLSLAVYASDMPEVLTYTYTDDDPLVDPQQIFLAVYDEVCDIRIEGARASFDFFYENIFRSTEKWRTFSSAVGVKALSEAKDAVSAEIAGALGGETAYFVDFRDGDMYPGTASVSVRADDVLDASAAYLLYEYIPAAAGTEKAAQVRPVATGLSLGADGALSFTLTEAHDYLLVVQTADAEAALSAYVYTPDYDAGGGFFGGANLGWIVFFVIVGLGLAGLVIYLVTVKVLLKRRKAVRTVKKK